MAKLVTRTGPEPPDAGQPAPSEPTGPWVSALGAVVIMLLLLGALVMLALLFRQ